MLKEIAFLGQDGIGKSTISEALAAALRARGHDVSIVSWTKSVRGVQKPASEFVNSALADLYCASYRGMYAAARSRDVVARDLFPATTEDFFAKKASEKLLDLQIVENATWGILGGAFAEMSGNYFFRHLEVAERIARGQVVIQETFGYKHLVKELYIAKQLASLNGEERYLPVIATMESLNELMFSTVLAPQFGFVVDCDPAEALKRRASQGGVGWTEDMQLACDRGPGSFVRMQQYTRDVFLSYAAKHNWPVIRTDEADEAQTVRNALDIVMSVVDGKST